MYDKLVLGCYVPYLVFIFAKPFCKKINAKKIETVNFLLTLILWFLDLFRSLLQCYYINQFGFDVTGYINAVAKGAEKVMPSLVLPYNYQALRTSKYAKCWSIQCIFF